MLEAFIALKLWAQIAIVGAVVAAIGGAVVIHDHRVFQSGYDSAISDIAHDNKEAVDAANKLKAKRRNCTADGGNWDQSVGMCR